MKKKQILGDVVTGYEFSAEELERSTVVPATPDPAVVQALYDRLVAASDKLSKELKSSSEVSEPS